MRRLPGFLFGFHSVRIAGVLTRMALCGLPGFFGDINDPFGLVCLAGSAGERPAGVRNRSVRQPAAWDSSGHRSEPQGCSGSRAANADAKAKANANVIVPAKAAGRPPEISGAQ